MEEKLRTLGALFAKHFSVELDTVRLRTGRLTERLRIDHPEAAAVLPFLDDRHLLMVRQWRYAIARETLEIPAGKVDPGEAVEICAQRELEEETGHRARRLLHLTSYFPAIGYSNETIRIYAASGLQPVSPAQGIQDMDEISRVEVLSLVEVQDLILRGSVTDGKTIIGISLFLARQQRGEIPRDFFAQG